MRIERVRIENFRSIGELDLELDKPQIILEGKNDTGKSNIVHAVDLCLRHFGLWLLGVRAGQYHVPMWPDRWSGRPESILRTGKSVAKAEVTVRLSPGERFTEGKHEFLTAMVEWRRQTTGLVSQNVSFRLPPDTRGLTDDDKQRLGDQFIWAYRLVEAHRKPREENFNANSSEPADALPVWRGDNLKSLLFGFKNHPRPEVQARFEEFVRRCADPDFPVGELTVGVSSGGRLFARTRQNGSVFDLEDRSDGIQQLVFLLAVSVCHTGSIVAIEEPEAHLNEGLQRTFWTKLQQMQGSGSGLEQVIVTSHSHVFELEADRVVVSRGTDGLTKAMHVGPRVESVGDYEPLSVTRNGTVHLSDDLRKRLNVEADGGLIYADTSGEGVRLLSTGAFAEETLGPER